MITFTGNNLNIVIYASFLPCDKWKTFATWYSVTKTLPDASASYFVYSREGVPDNLEWTIRAKLSRSHHLPIPSLILSAGLVAVQDFSEEMLKSLNSGTSFGDETAALLTGAPVSELKTKLWVDAAEEAEAPFIRFDKNECPFGDASKSAASTLNESKVLKMWAKMTTLYERLT